MGAQVLLPKGKGVEERGGEKGHPREAGKGFPWECESCRESISLRYNEWRRKIPQGGHPPVSMISKLGD